MERILLSLMVFLVIYIFYFLTILKNKKKIKQIEKNGQGSFIIKKYQLDVSLLNKKSFAHSIILTNSVIITLTFFITDFISHYFIKFLVGFILIVPLILFGYHLIGIYYKKKEVKKHV